jgi:hypothetical protein
MPANHLKCKPPDGGDPAERLEVRVDPQARPGNFLRELARLLNEQALRDNNATKNRSKSRNGMPVVKGRRSRRQSA